jgi:hypothetical protein
MGKVPEVMLRARGTSRVAVPGDGHTPERARDTACCVCLCKDGFRDPSRSVPVSGTAIQVKGGFEEFPAQSN